jgi:hypothetical protein
LLELFENKEVKREREVRRETYRERDGRCAKFKFRELTMLRGGETQNR